MQHAFDYLDAPVINCTGKDVPMPLCGEGDEAVLGKKACGGLPRLGDDGRADADEGTVAAPTRPPTTGWIAVRAK
jgi:hypothetical protein